MKNVKLKIIAIGAALFLLLPASSRAAGLYFGTAAPEVGVGQLVEVGVFLNTDRERINTVGGEIIFSSETLEFKETRDAGSIINFWVERPVVQDGTLRFSGIIPGGYIGDRGYLFSAIFEAKKVGAISVRTANEALLLNDGQGTAAPVRAAPLTLKIVSHPFGAEFVASADTDPPEPFTPILSQNPDMFDGQWFVVFSTADKGSGMDYYEVYETTGKYPHPTSLPTRERGRRTGGGWVRTDSPYVLRDQNLHSVIYVQAVDKAGNVRMAMLPARYPLRGYENYPMWSILIIVVGVLCAAARKLWRTKIKH